MNYAYIIAGAVAGAPLRYFIAARTQSLSGGTFPWGTFAVNITGCLIIGFLLTFAEERTALSREARLLLVTGFLGSYTTFSAFGWETFALLRDDRVLQAVANAVLSVVAGLLAVWLGSLAAKQV